ncbi:cleavage and polyadenylation specificity factor subunit 4-like [Mercenaria mercenaria]|uniref:cleavage and polyadenylation specificity factor subunit 4-like n=1 Tax=Mercenaria mercenaria TaxID=6596 RepID=UPI001E1DAA5D|nr:cleavage and polyadenylation specificity factor subunit 4-like [Mercenaria mercenaria]
MQDVVAPVSHITFDIEIALNNQLGSMPLPFPGMDKSGAAICTFFLTPVGCSKATACPFRHIKGEKTVVCKHWLRGLCKKGDDCEFLHEFDMTKMPECFFFSKYGQCNNKECPFLHIDPEQKVKDCAWYDRGFCRHGPNCKNRHVRRLICQNYLCGFCLDGPKCKFMHPRYDLPVQDDKTKKFHQTVTCHNCGESGHKSYQCPKLHAPSVSTVITTSGNTVEIKPVGTRIGAGIPGSGSHYGRGTFAHRGQPRLGFNFKSDNDQNQNLEFVTCFKCGLKGHYANRCPKGDLAFLSSSNIQTTT